MNKYTLLLFGLLLSFKTLSQQNNTEVFLVDVMTDEERKALGKPLNISNNEGYDNQPSFLDDDTILFSSTRNGQTDIALYTISTNTTKWITDTPKGSEYSPLKIPGKEAVSAIRLDADGLQRLYQYDINTGKSQELIKDLKVGYHVWYNAHIIVCTVLIENRMDLVVANLKDGTNYIVQKNVGRSLHKVPNTDLVSYISKANEKIEIKTIHPISGATQTINYIWNGREDMAWLSEDTIIAGTNSILAQVKADTTGVWGPFHTIDPLQYNNVSRIAVSPNRQKLALVAEPPAAAIVQKQVVSYNAGDLESFINCYSADVIVSNFPDKIWYEGHKRMREIYEGLSPTNKTYQVAVVKRIVIGSNVVDHEKVTRNGKFEQMQVAIYNVDKGAIERMTFIFDDTKAPNPETIVQKQLDAYNARDIDRFMDTYTDDISLFNYPVEKRSQGQEEMRKVYADFFTSTPDLHCEIKNRIVIGNKVIDEEKITANGNTFSTVAIYEVEDGKISKVYFLR
ncbi:nuclear transport factor 2 family protein [Maribacter sp. R77961]|uniref:nuclear transport factor 2 family protein n=1 Tax=Maribacter sp. R77961 TaxID=3093871 RepID=UPI0037CA4BA0